jgi:hypothetical protein
VSQVVVRCDRATVPVAWQGLRCEELRCRGARPNLNLHIESPSTKLLGALPPRAVDLVHIASYVYGADQLVSRGGIRDVYGDSWERDFRLCVPVSDPQFWSNKDVRLRLEEALDFLSGDRWEFRFSQAADESKQLPLELDPQVTLGEPDGVFLFSGGLDSLCAVVQAVEANGRPLLLGHSPAYHIAALQRNLAVTLKSRFKGRWHFPYLSVSVHRTGGGDPREYTQRTRSFLYASLGAVIADRLRIAEVALTDNGFVSLSLPVNDQLIGSRISRSTHWKFLSHFNELATLALRTAPKVVNPFWSRTRSEELEILKQAGMPDLVEQTNSCAHRRNLTSMRPHCGVCSQCVDRRFATLAAGLEEFDPEEAYETRVFRDALADGDARTTALSYVRFARRLSQLSGDEFYLAFSELYDCVPHDRTQRIVADAIVALLSRHASAVLGVLEDQIARLKKPLARGQLPGTSLLRLYTASAEVADKGWFQPGPGYREIRLGGDKTHLTPNQARILEYMDGQGDAAVSEGLVLEALSIKSKTFYQVFRGTSILGTLLVKADGKGLFRMNRVTHR